jgi:hypothetical protein
MQNLPVYLYNYKLDITLDLDATVRGVNQVMYQRDLKIQKGIKNQVRVQFKNSDQKNVKIYNTQTFVFSMFDAMNQRLIVEKELEVLDVNTTATRGLALLTLNESDTLDLDRTSYQYSVKLLDAEGSAYTPTYANTYYGMAGTVHLNSDIFPVLQDSKVIDAFIITYNDDIQLYEHKSGNIYASPEYNGNNALHTLAMYMTGYKGTVYIQGTLDNSPGSSGNYSTIATRTYTGFTGIDPVNFNGVYTYIRIVHVPAIAPAESNNDNPSFFGSFDKALYRS